MIKFDVKSVFKMTFRIPENTKQPENIERGRGKISNPNLENDDCTTLIMLI